MVLILSFLKLHCVKVMSEPERTSALGYEAAGAIFAIVIGSMLHFTFELSGHQQVVGVFSAVNECVGAPETWFLASFGLGYFRI